MDPFSVPLIAGLLDAASAFLGVITTLITPFGGTASAALAIVALTVIVRTFLIPVGVSQVRAEFARRRLAPQLAVLQARYKKNPTRLQEKTLELYRREKTSPVAGLLPVLAQAPVLSLVYALFLRDSIDGQPNPLLGETLAGVPLGSSLSHMLAGGEAWPAVAVFLVLLAVMAATAAVTRRVARRWQADVAPAPLAPVPLARVAASLSWLPFLTVAFAAMVPLAATLYLTVTTAWTLAERSLLRRRFLRGTRLPRGIPA
ncbi:MAG: membrane protein insertase YidC [Burkholderiaceae bacterium]|nr:membrane protein insertase YidC [Microbacteriaceae bacterium]